MLNIMDLELSGKSALVTGASKGIGLAVAEALAAEGATLHLVARSEGALERTADEIRERYGVPATIQACDVSDSKSIDALVSNVSDVDILVNNAGAIGAGSLEAIDEARWREAWELKLFGYINMTRAFYARMSERGSGVIINVTGLAGQRLDANYIAGSVANAGLDTLSRAQGAYSLEKGVRVLAVSPGPVATDRVVTMMRARAASELGNEDRWQEFMKALPEGRAAKPEEVANVVAFLASDKAHWVNGVVVTVDGGQNARGSSFS